jgi:polyhydroxybutyrate depolymerase
MTNRIFSNLLLTGTVFIAVLVVGCTRVQRGNPTGFVRNNTLKIAELERSYDAFIPMGLDATPRPLIFLLHGNGGSAAQLMGLDGKAAPFKLWQEIAEREKLILIIPEGRLGSDQKQGWNDCRTDAVTNPETDDVGFISALLDGVVMKYPVDKRRVFATGISNGGHMSLRLALELPDRIAAIAAIAASMPATSECKLSSTPISVLLMNGTKDPIAPYIGGVMGYGKSQGERGSILSTEAAVQSWVTLNQTKTVAESRLIDTNSSDDGLVTRFEYCCGKNATQVVLYKVEGGGHTEPSTRERYSSIFKLIVGPQNSDLEMADEVWDFFRNKLLAR